MIVLDGMPGAGKTTLLSRLHALAPHHVLVFPEAQPSPDSASDAETAGHLLDVARARIDTAGHLARTWPDLLVTSDRGHIGVLAYRHALATAGLAPRGDFERALALCRDRGLLDPQPGLTTVVLLVDVGTSLARRAAHTHDQRYQLWFDPRFLTAYHAFLEDLSSWIPPTTFTTVDARTTDQHELLAALSSLAGPLPPRPDPIGDDMNTPSAATTRRLLTTLAAIPDPQPMSPTMAALDATVDDIRAHLTAADQHDAQTITTETLHTWRNALDQHHQDLEQHDPHGWARWRQPGTWLDCHLRLRSLIAHEVAKAYWDERPEIYFADIDIERYLWGAR